MKLSPTVANILSALASGLILVFFGYLFYISDTPEYEPELQNVAVEPVPANVEETLRLVNLERNRNGSQDLVIDNGRQTSAQMKANYLEENNYFGHFIQGTSNTLTQEMADVGLANCATPGSENLAKIDNYTTSRELVDAWLESPSHRKALLDPIYDITGLAMSNDGTIVVQHFCTSK